MVQFPWYTSLILFYSDKGNHHNVWWMGFPIRKSPDYSQFAATRSLSQLTTSFIDFWDQIIRHKPFVAWPQKLPFIKIWNYQRTIWFLVLVSWLKGTTTKSQESRAKNQEKRTVEMRGFEPLTSCVQSRRSPNWTTSPEPQIKQIKGKNTR